MNTSHTELESLKIIELDQLTSEQFKQYYLDNTIEIESDLLKHGVVKFRGVSISSTDDFGHIVDGVSDKFMEYIDGNSPRTKLTGNVYTSTEYDSTQKITMHNELSYSAKWPSRLFLSCITPSETGGETLLADSREIYNAMNQDIVDQITTKGIAYVRNLHSGQGLGPSWQETFETENKAELEAYCKAYSIDLVWKDDGGVKLVQNAKGILSHRETKEKLWFNQIDQFHASHLGEELFEVMQSMYESSDDYPMHVRFGNGDEITIEIVKEIIRTIEKFTFAPKWEKNEFLIIDNELTCHGRNPYTGDRKVLLSMSE